MDEATFIATRRAAIWAELAAGTASKPDYTTGAKTVNWTTYKKSLYEELDELDKLERKLEGPYIVTQVMG